MTLNDQIFNIKIMKKILLFILTLFTFINLDSVFAINITTHNSIQTNCNWWIFPPLTIYWNDWYHLWDRLNASWEWLISSNSEVSVYINSNKINIPNWWVQVSNYVPSAWPFYAVWNNNLTTLNIPNLVPADRDQPIAQIVYKIRRMYTWSNNTYNYNWNYIYSPFTWAIPIQTNLWNLNRNFDPSTLTADEECIAIVPRWCWDWVLDVSNWEQCDPNDPSSTWFWTSWCSTTCQPINWWWWSASCSNLTMNWGNTQTSFTAPTTINFQWFWAGSLWSNPEYRLILTNNANSSIIATYTWTTWAFNHTFNSNVNFTATLYIDNTPYWTVWWSNGCLRTWSMWGWWGWWGNTWYSCNTSNSCWSYSSQIACENSSAWKTCYLNDNTSCLNTAPVQCPDWWGWWLSTRCWDWIIQRPNSNGQMETCDTPEPWCNWCSTTITNPWETGPGNITITNPWETWLPISLSDYRIIVGNNSPLFATNDIIKFSSNKSIYLWGKTVWINNNYNSIITWNSLSYIMPNWSSVWRVDYFERYVRDWSWNIIDIIYRTINNPYSITLFNWNQISWFRWNTSNFWPNEIFRDTNMSSIFPSQWENNFYVNIQFLEEAMPIRVSRNIISSIAGWNSLVYNPVWFDVNYVVNNFIDWLASGNFVGTNLNKDMSNWKKLSGQNIDINDENKIEDVSKNFDNETINVDKTNIVLPWIEDIQINSSNDFVSKLSNMWDKDNIKTSINWDVFINPNSFDLKLSNKKTIIIENWDLVINRNLSYLWNNDSWAFIVKNWNLIISKNVSKIAWIFIVLDWKIKSDWEKTSKQLFIDGNLYWDSSDLSNNRTFVRWTNKSSALTTWIVINYSNRALKNPPPMLNYFIEQFNQKKIAR